MSDAKTAADPTAAPAPPSGGGSKLMPALVGFNSLLLVGVLGFMAYQMMHKPAEEHGSEDAKAEAKAEPKEAPAEGHAEPTSEGHEGPKKEGEAAAPTAAGTGPGPMVKLPDFVVHLRNPDLDRYARITFEVEVMAEPDKDRLKAHLPRVRDAFISYLSDRTVEELSGSEGLGRTKDALQLRLRELVPEARFRALYISDFVVQ